jgi:hypothetical protein
MYLIHQDAYLRLTTADLTNLLFGPGRSGVRAAYPNAVDPDLARRVLSEYRLDHLVESFLIYMDAHNEYLNLATAFGLPAVALLAAFMACLARRGAADECPPIAVRLLPFLVVGIAGACLWDDLLSKRWIWATLGLLAAQLPAAPPAIQTHPGDAPTNPVP